MSADHHIIPHRCPEYHRGRGDLHVATVGEAVTFDSGELKRRSEVVRGRADVLERRIRDERNDRSWFVREHAAIEAVDGLRRDSVRERGEYPRIRALHADEVVVLARRTCTGEAG